jgi:hypothetical protein
LAPSPPALVARAIGGGCGVSATVRSARPIFGVLDLALRDPRRALSRLLAFRKLAREPLDAVTLRNAAGRGGAFECRKPVDLRRRQSYPGRPPHRQRAMRSGLAKPGEYPDRCSNRRNVVARAPAGQFYRRGSGNPQPDGAPGLR